jgi:prolipoprotein diacylglyceryltransferase
MTNGTLPPRLRILGRSWSSFQVCGVIGLALGTSLALSLASYAGLSRVVVVVLLSSGLVTFLALAMGHKIVTGREALVYYHHEIAILSVAAALLATLQLPVLPYLDVTALGLGVFLACGRIGCLMVGCCHGKPGRWGVRYGVEHAVEGFPGCYVGARLFPVQALEAVLVALVVAAGAIAILQRQPAGTAWSLYVVSYAAARVWLEELRGDGIRPYALRLSEAQWTSLAIILAVVLAGWQGRVPWSPWHGAAALITAASLAWIAARRHGRRALLHPRHAGEIAEIVNAAPSVGAPIAVQRTSQTIGVSTQPLGPHGADDTRLYSISRADRRLTLDEAAGVARLIADLVAAGASRELVRGGRDVFHLIVHRSPRGAAVPGRD